MFDFVFPKFDKLKNANFEANYVHFTRKIALKVQYYSLLMDIGHSWKYCQVIVFMNYPWLSCAVLAIAAEFFG